MSVFVYILSNPLRSSIYVGFTSDLSSSLHKLDSAMTSKIPKKHNHLIYLEMLRDADSARLRMQQFRRGRRKWKWQHIMNCNPDLREMNDVTDAIFESALCTS
ncbi:GIY-YIG nuclease family protein [Flavobacterium silvaticum]|uniref:GIY-YIG nuclease family protein n=1 Tax=Flavobacterium silvaticum TaxID=1852020 RepID=A0A972FYF6_9FLAO|nr:GIY-YIG nuclease family protein [Flavobacterium silvaticum]NMH27141.1 GIY-YIG nuclease family protein [Flavobacterium silvaticum]